MSAVWFLSAAVTAVVKDWSWRRARWWNDGAGDERRMSLGEDNEVNLHKLRIGNER